MRRIFAQTIYDLPIPSGLSVEEEDQYTTMLEEIATPIEDEAVQRLELAMQKSRQLKISNEWTRKILETLHLYKPRAYPLFKAEKRLSTPELHSNARFLLVGED